MFVVCTFVIGSLAAVFQSRNYANAMKMPNKRLHFPFFRMKNLRPFNGLSLLKSAYRINFVEKPLLFN